MSTTTVYTSISAAILVASNSGVVPDVVISFKRNKTTQNPIPFERAIVLPLKYFFPIDIDVSETIQAVIKTARIQSAIQILKKFCESTEYDSQIPLSILQPELLDKNFVEGNETSSDWLSKDELQTLWNSSKTRNVFVSRDIYQTNKTYQQAVLNFEKAILSLAGKATKLSSEMQDIILAKLDSDDLNSPLGKFIVFRISKMKESLPEIDFTALLFHLIPL